MFLENKYTHWYYSIINRAKCQDRKKLKRSNSSFVYYESHHIIPKCINGIEEVLLTAKEHYICHLLLCKMVEGQLKHKMINALIKMQYCKSKGQSRYTSRTFSLIRIFIAQKNHEIFKGKKFSKEHNEKISKARMGMKFSETHCKNLSIAMQKRVKSNTYVNSMSNPEHRAKISKYHQTHTRIYNPISLKCFFVSKEKLESYLLQGFIRGMPKNLTIIICPKCKKEGRSGGMQRFHFDNCRWK